MPAMIGGFGNWTVPADLQKKHIDEQNIALSSPLLQSMPQQINTTHCVSVSIIM